MGSVACRACKGSGRFYSKSGKAFDCRACGGTGINKDLWSTNCERCRTEIIYKAYSNTPRFCKSCREIQLEKACAQSGCTNTIRYKVGWDNVSNYCKRCETKRQQGWSASTCPGTGIFGCGKLIWSPPGKRFDLCPDCSAKKRAERDAKRREKTCQGIKGGPYCGKTIFYYTDSQFVPDLCPDCRAKAKAAKEERERNRRTKPCPNCGSTITYYVGGKEFDYCKSCSEKLRSAPREKVFWPADRPLPASDRSLNDLRSQGINGVSVKTNGLGGYHVTLFSSNDRYSYDTDRNGNFVPGKAHYTDAAAKLLGKDTIGPDATGENRW